ncbi:hypothetical protein ACCO45_007168 [Purpureocillium lilacinum]|uniref:Uncharacterized protein n=1 Tax=Purpureocillium lilacinum TaxID=33203 RepID=A0ACC4DUB4_PURLI
MIEGWELDRHEAVLDRAGRDWWDITGPDGETFRFEKVEFPYDIGFFSNMAQGMGTPNVLLWFFPLAGNPSVSRDNKGSGWTWEENGFNRIEGIFDERQGHGPPREETTEPSCETQTWAPRSEKKAFRERQEQDERRKKTLLAELEEVDGFDMMNDDGDDIDDLYDQDSHDSAEWANSDGERLRDFGVDEDAEDADAADPGAPNDDDVPLGELLRRRKVLHKDDLS